MTTESQDGDVQSEAPQRPEWLPEKFKSPEDLTQSYKALEQRLGSAPKEYDLSKGESWVNPEFEGVGDMLKLAKEKSVPQEVMDSMLDTAGRYIQSLTPQMEVEREKLGPEAGERLEKLNNWAKSNLTEDSYYALTESMTSAQSVIALEELRSRALDNNTMVPNGNLSAEASSVTMDELQSEINNNLDKYKNDKSYRNDVLSRMQKLQLEGYVDKSSA